MSHEVINHDGRETEAEEQANQARDLVGRRDVPEVDAGEGEENDSNG